MGSRIMHAIIANRIADRLCIEDKTSFILGNIAPDAVTTKNESHFFIGEHLDHSRSLDFKGFLNKYSSKADDLNVFTLDQIVCYIETSVDLGVLHLKQVAIVHKIPWAREWFAEHV